MANLSSDKQGDGVPLLHLAVLHKQTAMVRLMVGGQPVAGLNGVRDQFRCSALHYAYADGDSQQIQQLLLEAGCSEVAFDMVRILQVRASRRRCQPSIGPMPRIVAPLGVWQSVQRRLAVRIFLRDLCTGIDVWP